MSDPHHNEAKPLHNAEFEEEASDKGKSLEAVSYNAASLHCFPCIGVPWVHRGFFVGVLSPELSHEKRCDCLDDSDETCSEISSEVILLCTDFVKTSVCHM